MKEDKSSSSLFDGATSPAHRSKTWTKAVCFLLLALLMMHACTRDRSPEKTSRELPRAEDQREQNTTPSPPQPREMPEPSPTATQSQEGSGDIVTAKGIDGQVIAGV